MLSQQRPTSGSYRIAEFDSNCLGRVERLRHVILEASINLMTSYVVICYGWSFDSVQLDYPDTASKLREPIRINVQGKGWPTVDYSIQKG